jgi:hypothetical protein
MNHNYIDQFDLIDRYLIGKLPAEEGALFEEHFVDCPQCIDRLKTTKNFLQDLRLVSARQAFQTGKYGLGPRWPFPQVLAQKPFALAVSTLLVALIAGMIFAVVYMQRLRFDVDQAKLDSSLWQRSYEEERQSAALSDKKRQEVEQELTVQLRELEAKLHTVEEPRGGIESGVWMQPSVNVPIISLNPVTRGEDTANEVTLPHSPIAFLVSIGLEGETKYENYRITILDDQKRAIYKKPGLKANRYNSLSIGFNSKFFQPGNYSLVVEGVVKKNGISLIGDYPLRIIKNR